MQKADYMAIKSQMSFEKPLWITLAVIVMDWVIVWLAFTLLTNGGWVSYIASQLLLATFFFHNFALLHEAGHGNIHKERWINYLVGHYASIFCFMPFFSWKHMHQGHHVYVGNIDKDPTMKPIKKMRQDNAFPLIGSLSWPTYLPFIAVLQHYNIWKYCLRLRKDDEGKQDPMYFHTIFSTLFLVAAYAMLIYALPQYITFQNLWLAFVFYLIITEAENLPHHAYTPTFSTTPERDRLHPWEQSITTRSCKFPPLMAELLALNFNLHTEHHFLPNLPWYRLKKLQKHIRASLPGYTEVNGIGWNIRSRLRTKARDLWLTEITHPLLKP
jgi:omega-6 fatty acid desaturase (delta-12 desaturase)